MAKENLTGEDETQKAALGEYRLIDGTGYMYVQASVAITAYQACTVANDGTIGQASDGGTYPLNAVLRNVVIPQFAMTADYYGWALAGPFHLDWKGNSFKVDAAASCALDVVLYTSATAGRVDDASASQTQIQGLLLTATVGGGLRS